MTKPSPRHSRPSLKFLSRDPAPTLTLRNCSSWSLPAELIEPVLQVPSIAPRGDRLTAGDSLSASSTLPFSAGSQLSCGFFSVSRFTQRAPRQPPLSIHQRRI